jgi:hypothetical protein
VRTSHSPDIATLDEHVSVEHDEEVPGELLVDSDSDNKLNPIDSENDDGEDETFVEDREILDPTEKEDDTAAVILSNARTVKEHFNSEQRCPPCPPPDNSLAHFPKWPHKSGCKICDACKVQHSPIERRPMVPQILIPTLSNILVIRRLWII